MFTCRCHWSGTIAAPGGVCGVEVIRDTIHDTFRMLFLVALMTAAGRNEHPRIVRSYVKPSGSVSVDALRTITEGSKDHKLVLVAKNQADRLQRQIGKLGHFLKARKPEAATTAPVVRLYAPFPIEYGTAQSPW